jgi:RNA polymerase sigma-70 factor, ECF subfamily
MAESSSDDHLIERLRAMEPAAWDRVMHTYKEGIFFACLGQTRNRADAEDICSQAFLRAVRGIGRFRGDSSIKTWLHTIAANLCHTHRRRHGENRHVPLDEAPEKALEAEIIAADHVVGRAEIRTALVSALDLLDPVLRHAFHLRTFEEMSYEEIARVTGVPVNTVKTRIFRARERLQRLLAEYR